MVAVGLPKVGDVIRVLAAEAALTGNRLMGGMIGSTRLSVDGRDWSISIARGG